MVRVFFGLKRAYHGTLRVLRRALARLGLTAARFDLLYILHEARGRLLQRELQRTLGVAASTVSRMLSSLEQLGWVGREPAEVDGRAREVVLTPAGRHCVLRAAHRLIHTGCVQLAVDSALCPERWDEPIACLMASGACEETSRRLREAFGDVATDEYPYLPEDDPCELPASWFNPRK
jgi:DNA-binding MarR family transcriptional regulator